MRYSGCIYADPPKRADAAGPKDLTVHELKDMKLVGLPVRIEHGTRAEVGRVVSSSVDPTTGYTTVDYTLHSNPAGYAANALLKSGPLRQLSLKHWVYGDRKEPEEVSLVVRGLRPNTDVFSNAYEKENGRLDAQRIYKKGLVDDKTKDDVMEETVKATPTPTKDVITPPVVEPEAKPPPVEKSRSEQFDDIAKTIPDGKTRKRLYEMMSDNMREIIESRNVAQKLNEENESLRSLAENTNKNTKMLTEQVVGVFADLYEKFVPQHAMNDEQKKCFTRSLERDPSMLEFMQPIPVLASAIASKTESAACGKITETERELEESRQTLRMWENTYKNMGGQGIWKSQDFPTPSVTARSVAASGFVSEPVHDNTPKVDVLPAWIRQNVGAYNDSSHQSQRIFASDFNGVLKK